MCDFQSECLKIELEIMTRFFFEIPPESNFNLVLQKLHLVVYDAICFFRESILKGKGSKPKNNKVTITFVDLAGGCLAALTHFHFFDFKQETQVDLAKAFGWLLQKCFTCWKLTSYKLRNLKETCSGRVCIEDRLEGLKLSPRIWKYLQTREESDLKICKCGKPISW
ncbi:hypothetical protein DASC09_005320 [Saccharomycopsis crataegensis]|uniref:Uncharacterized protein n=1 Tax=Saccharomycopsis crataegensis TaxID=43959 RepID=A0AAV5QEN8_9ASCO|nr:hypothetical protein DASC09_005320 [Saccharomycopsis crataegensis]